MATDLGVFNWPGGSGSGSGSLASAIYNISSGVSTFNVTYDVTLSSSVCPIISLVNTTDATPIFLQALITAFSTSGFTVLLNTSTDTANYQLQYAVLGAV